VIHSSINAWLQTAAHLNRKANLGEYNMVIALITRNLLEVMVPIYKTMHWQIDTDTILPITMKHLHNTRTLLALRSDQSRAAVVESAMVVSDTVTDNLATDYVYKHTLSESLRGALETTVRLIGDKVAAIEKIPDWCQLGKMPEHWDSLSDGEDASSEGSASRSDVDCSSPPFGLSYNEFGSYSGPGSGSGSGIIDMIYDA
jgi:hypothetical protein